MATRLFRTVKFTYSPEIGEDRLRAQRVYGDSLTREILTPITPLLTAREIPGVGVTDAFSGNERHVLARIKNTNTNLGYSSLKVIIPYRSDDVNLRNHIAEINELVACTYYYGEDDE